MSHTSQGGEIKGRHWLGFSGDLRQDSPSAAYLVKQSMGQEELENLSFLYSKIFAANLLLEPRIKRIPGVRFNPRPGRLLYILLKEANVFDPHMARQMLIKSREFEVGDLGKISSLSFAAFEQAPYLSLFVLDELRHFHLNLSVTSENCLEFQQNLLGLCEEGAFSKWPKIEKLIKAALARYSTTSNRQPA